MERARSFLQSPTYGNVITVLSIDGGGIRGIIPGVILCCLESELQVKNDAVQLIVCKSYEAPQLVEGGPHLRILCCEIHFNVPK